MRRNTKAKLDIYAKMPLQLISENSIEELVVTAAVSGTSNILLEKKRRR
jgi:hypothetical protein